MFEYHGWITVRNSPGEEEGEEMIGPSLRADIDAELAKFASGIGLSHAQTVNGATQLYFGGFLNHRSGGGNDVIEAFDRIARLTPGSYGLLYVWDDEDPGDHRNAFQVFVMRRGKVTRHTDAFLSPCVPAIEDEII